MKRFDKKIAVLLGIILCFIIGGTLSFESLARFTKKFETVNKKVSVATFEVSADSEFVSESEIKPGDVLSADTIKLKNDNDYPVEFTISLSEKSENNNKDKSTSEGAKDLIEYLTLTIDGVNQTESKNHYTTIVNPNNEKVVSAKIEWITDDDIEIYENDILDNIASYTYDIKAKQLTNKDSGSNDNIGGGNSDGGEGNGGTTPGNGSNDGNEDIKSVSLKDISWVATTEGNKSKIKVFDDYTIVGANANAVLENLSFDLKEEKIIFNADIELLNTNATDGKGLNFAVGVKDSNESARNRLTYQLYKDNKSENKELYGNVTNVSNPVSPSDIARNGAKTIETLNITLVGEIIERDNFAYAKFSMRDRNNNIVGSEDIEVRCGEYKSTDKAYINIGSIIGQEGIKINSMEVKAVTKE